MILLALKAPLSVLAVLLMSRETRAILYRNRTPRQQTPLATCLLPALRVTNTVTSRLIKLKIHKPHKHHNYDLPSKDSTTETKNSHFTARNQNHKKKRTKSTQKEMSFSQQKKCNQEPVTRRSHDTDKQLVHQQKLDLGNTQAGRKKGVDNVEEG